MEEVSKLHVSWSEDRTLSRAVSRAVGTCLEKAACPVAAMVFSAGNWDRGALARALNAELGHIPWVGSTAAIVFANSRVIREGIAIGIISAADACIGVGMSPNVSQNPALAGQKAVAMAIDHMPELSFEARESADAADVSSNADVKERAADGAADDAGKSRRAIWLLADSFMGEGSGIVQGAVREGGTSVCWSGVGVGGRGRRSGRMSLLANGSAFLDRAVALAIDLKKPFGSCLTHSREPFGPPLSVTRCRDRGSIVQELDYCPAGECFERVARAYGPENLREADMRMLFKFCSIGIPMADGGFVIRDIVQLNDRGELQFVAPVPEGCIVRLMRGEPENLIRGASEAARKAVSQAGGRTGGLIFADCDGRALFLGDDVGRELAEINRAAGEGTDVLGCTSYGEVGRLSDGFPQFHNRSIQVTALPA